MWVSLPGNPIPFDRYRVDTGYSGPVWLPWYIWGGGTLATKYEYDTSRYRGYGGAIPVPLSVPGRIDTLGVRGVVRGMTSRREGAFLLIRLYEQHQNIATRVSEIAVDRRTVADSSIGRPHIQIFQNASNFSVHPKTHSLSIEVLGLGQGIATVYALMVEIEQ